MFEDDEDVPRDISLQKSVKLILCLFSKKHTRRVSSLFCRLLCPKKKIQTLLSSLSQKIFLSSFSPFLCLYEKSLFLFSVFSVWRHTKSCCRWCCLCSKINALTLSLSNSNSVTLSLSLKKNKRAQNEEEEAEED